MYNRASYREGIKRREGGRDGGERASKGESEERKKKLKRARDQEKGTERRCRESFLASDIPDLFSVRTVGRWVLPETIPPAN